MGSKAGWDAENRKALELIHWTLCVLQARCAATEASPPSPYGRSVDAVAAQGFYLAILEEFARLQARIDALKVRVGAGYPATPAPDTLAHSTPNHASTSGREGESALGGGCLNPHGLGADAVHGQQLPAAQ
jgi:hypothetical protein